MCCATNFTTIKVIKTIIMFAKNKSFFQRATSLLIYLPLLEYVQPLTNFYNINNRLITLHKMLYSQFSPQALFAKMTINNDFVAKKHQKINSYIYDQLIKFLSNSEIDFSYGQPPNNALIPFFSKLSTENYDNDIRLS